ncbi:MAG: hypothetical protein AAB390_00780 [Patescibacteria group bacterium]
MKYLLYAALAAVAITIVASLTVVGSPAKERDRRADDIRLSNLQVIQSQLLEYWQAKKNLPENLAALNDDLRRVSIPKDPKDGSDYSYRKISDLSFEICANFTLVSEPDNNGKPLPIYSPYEGEYVGPYGGNGNIWTHPAGRYCYTRVIDKDFFAPEK